MSKTACLLFNISTLLSNEPSGHVVVQLPMRVGTGDVVVVVGAVMKLVHAEIEALGFDGSVIPYGVENGISLALRHGEQVVYFGVTVLESFEMRTSGFDETYFHRLKPTPKEHVFQVVEESVSRFKMLRRARRIEIDADAYALAVGINAVVSESGIVSVAA